MTLQPPFLHPTHHSVVCPVEHDCTSFSPGQMLTYVMVIDFESTCWKDKKTRPEISESCLVVDHAGGPTCATVPNWMRLTLIQICKIFWVKPGPMH